jgi:hypothetical protein
MSGRNVRKEPGFSDPEQQSHQDDLFDSRLPPKDELDPRLRVAAIAVTLVCALFIADWAYQRYAEYRAVQALNEMVADLEETTQAATRSLQRQARESAAQRQAAAERTRREADRRRLALREQRGNTTQGKWLAKNCSDWRQAHQDIGGPTAEREMKRHCRLYEEYLETGIAVTPVR